MFNLIVSGDGWEPHRDSFGSGRVLEYTDAAIAQRFMPNKVLDINAVAKLPTLFMAETQGAGNQVAHVGTITQLKLSGTDFQIEYAVDPAIRPTPNTSLLRMARELGIEEFEFSRTHWAIKDADLYKALLRNLYSDLPTPKVFQHFCFELCRSLPIRLGNFAKCTKFNLLYAASKVDLAGPAKHRHRLGACQRRLERSDEPVRNPLRRSLHQ